MEKKTMIKVISYNQEQCFNTKEEGLRFFRHCMCGCDINSHEYLRYEYAYSQILLGKTDIDTDMEQY